MFFPTIQLQAGKAIQVTQQGLQVIPEDPIDLSRRLYRYGTVVILDRDAAQGQGNNRNLVSAICDEVEAIVGGGITTVNQADQYLRSGAVRLIFGPQVDPGVLAHFPRQRILVAVDDRPEPFGLDEWKLADDKNLIEAAILFQKHCTGLVYGFGDSDIEGFRSLNAQVDLPVIAAAMATSTEDVEALDRSGKDCLLEISNESQVDISDLWASLLDFESGNGLIPTILQDKNRQVLALFYSNKNAVKTSLRNGLASFWSASKGDVTLKETPKGNPISIRTAIADRRRRVLLYQVDSSGPVCHTGEYSCFGERAFSIQTLEAVIVSRQEKGDSQSYTQQVLVSREGVTDQILTRAQELSQATTRTQMISRTADLLYFVMVNLVRNKISWSSVLKELRGRAGRRRQ